jgi:glutamate synthase domain-containing protein 3
VIVPPAAAQFAAHDNAIVGNGALYGATGGALFVHGRAGDRFAVRNSGAQAVVEGAGLHACEYMTGGTVAILGAISDNAGAGMTGGVLWLPRSQVRRLNGDYVVAVEPNDITLARLRRLLADYLDATQSPVAADLLAEPDRLRRHFIRVVSVREAAEAARDEARAG